MHLVSLLDKYSFTADWKPGPNVEFSGEHAPP